jgi:anti-sigma factor RsiW
MAKLLQRIRLRRDHRWAPGRMSAYLDAELAARARARLERHAEECPECRGVLYGLRRMLGLLEGLRAVGEREGAPDIAGAVGRRLHEPPAR